MLSEIQEVLVASIEQLLAVLEAQIPASPAAKQNEKLPDKLENEMQGYFRAMELAFPYDEIAAIYAKLVPPDLTMEADRERDELG